MTNKHYPLRQVIFDDLVNNNKLAILLLLLLTGTAVVTVWITHQTRLLITEKEKLIKQQHQLNNQYLHLQLEENSKTQKPRVVAAAKKFGLQSIQKEQEIIIIE
ncbi:MULTISPECIES: cell division protein FtsL [Pasteurellaceae]|uniref:Cell division protein FtsL n=3 Tax=Pasteurellaceae TaxID=712 RepID=A0AAQ4LYY9_9PAST|nr:cell division protein FtsL [Pasteurella atlantica]MBR0572889.1 cell division protein FtsL [Pasteurella atlantica]MDP8038817.1 cell division protein FtsL [Pasteurella atlantica]MDP8040908.1 cell division protein FtsL [Pasteurella atlantica]MDP8042918.1 cell division protein FtsL [Pasteurella atlantica]MDP8045005.1 cell division protein FtsL [Pasteurella atlantica]